MIYSVWYFWLIEAINAFNGVFSFFLRSSWKKEFAERSIIMFDMFLYAVDSCVVYAKYVASNKDSTN